MKSTAHQSIVNRPLWWLSWLLPFALVLAACAPAAAAPTVAPTAIPVATIAPTNAVSVPVTGSEAVINVATDPKLGQILVGANGMTLYMFGKDTPDKSNCSANCLKSWPPLVTQGNPTLGSGVDASLVGSTSLADGSKIVTYNHLPLYYFAKDTKAGDTNGQGVGGVWFVVSPDGKPVGMQSPAANGTSAAPTAAASSSEATINISNNATLGQFLVNGSGMTLYIFTKDQPDKSVCATSANCIKAWPPLLTQGNPTLGTGVDASLVGSATLPDGTKIVTYNHMPLYTYVPDTKPGDTNGQGVGSVWFVIAPTGKPVGQ